MTALFDSGLSLSGDASDLFGLVGFAGDLCMKVSIPDWIRLLTGFLCPAINIITIMFSHLVLVATCPTCVSTFRVHLDSFPHVMLNQNGRSLHFRSAPICQFIFTV